MHGRRFVDTAWVASNTKRGRCIAFQPWIHIASTSLWASAAFAAEHANHMHVLRMTERHSPLRHGTSSFRVVLGPMPADVLAKKSATKLAVVSQAEFASMTAEHKQSKRFVGCAGLAAHVTALYGPERAA